MPTLGDLYECLKRQPEPQVRRIVTALELYVTGSLNYFNHHTSVQLNNRLVCFDIKKLGNKLKPLAMLILQNFVWNRISANRDKGQTTRYYIDEISYSAQRTADGSVFHRHLEAMPQMGLRGDRHHAERQGSADQPGNPEYL